MKRKLQNRIRNLKLKERISKDICNSSNEKVRPNPQGGGTQEKSSAKTANKNSELRPKYGFTNNFWKNGNINYF